MWDKRLAWAEKQHTWDVLSRLASQANGGEITEFWIGLDDRKENGTWVTSFADQSVDVGHSHWLDGYPTGSGLCGEIQGPNGGFFSSATCKSLKAFACQSSPLDIMPDNACPLDFIPYKSLCFVGVKLPQNYSQASVIKCLVIDKHLQWSYLR
jgi:hypothetical protein